MPKKDPMLNELPELYDIQMIESLDIPKGKELICTELDLESEEIDSMNACARVLGLIPEDDSLMNIQIKAISMEEKRVLGFIAYGSKIENSDIENADTKRKIIFLIKEGCKEEPCELKDFTLTKNCSDGRNHTEWLPKGIVDNPIESAYLLLLHKILIAHGVMRDNTEYISSITQ